MAARTVELIRHCETFRRAKGLPEISYEVGTEEVHGGLADERTFDTFIAELKAGLAREGLSDIWPCFIVGKVGTDLHTTLFDTEVARSLTAKVCPLGSYIKGHYPDGVSNPQDYPLCGMGAANVGPEFTMSEYDGLAELERTEQKLLAEGRIAMRSRITETLERLVEASGRWKKWLLPAEEGSAFGALSAERRTWLGKTGWRPNRREGLPLHLAGTRSARSAPTALRQPAPCGNGPRRGGTRPHRTRYGQVFLRIQSGRP